MQQSLRIAIIYGSVRQNRFCDTVGAWVVSRIEAYGAYSLDVIDPAQRDDTNEDERVLRRRIQEADAFVIVTPEYNHSYPASLKSLIDSVRAEWRAKPVAFVCYGGVSGGLRAVEHLRGVFAELHAVGIRDSVSFANAWDRFDGAGGLQNAGAALAAMDTLLARLGWWAWALREARQARRYPEATA